MPDNASGRLSEGRKGGRKRKGNSTRAAGMQGISLSLPTAAITFVKGGFWFAMLRALAPWGEITDVTEGNGRELPFWFYVMELAAL